MNKAYCISYIFHTEKDRNKLDEALKSFKKWWHYLENTWLVGSDESADEIYKALSKHLGTYDSILIIEVRANFQGLLPEDAWKWINDNVPKP